MAVTKMTTTRAIQRKRTGAVSLQVPIKVDGKETLVEIGIQATSLPVGMLGTASGAQQLRAALDKALTQPILVKYDKGLVEHGTLADAITDTIIAKIRETE